MTVWLKARDTVAKSPCKCGCASGIYRRLYCRLTSLSRSLQTILRINLDGTDLKKIYGAVTLEEAEKNLQTFAEAWRKQYPSCVKSWEENWPVLSTFFEYPVEIRKIIYTTNIIEGLNRQFRQITKNKPSFTNDDSLRRMLYLASQRIVKHWHARYQNWDLVLSQLEIMFADRAIG